MFAKVAGVSVLGMEGRQVDVEIDIAGGLPDFHVVGLPSAAIREARRRVRAAVVNSGHAWPQRAITASLAPADLRKDGALFDLPLAVGVLAAHGDVKVPDLSRYMLLGELTLDGRLRPVRGALAAALSAREAGWKGIVLPRENAAEATLVPGIDVFGAANLAEALAFLGGTPGLAAERAGWADPFLATPADIGPDLSDVRGQALVLRALEIAAAGEHNLLMIGPPGCGKTMMAQRLPGILPPLTPDEALEVTRIWSVAGMLQPEQPLVVNRPFRAPHHNASAAAIVGGGSPLPRPGEISLAHRGVLFLDELPLFSPAVLEALRQPLEEGAIRVVRQGMSAVFPAAVSLVGAANPCLCSGTSDGGCICSPTRLESYAARLSGPLLDRIDLQVEVPRLTQDELFELAPSEPSASVRARVIQARQFRLLRVEGQGEDPAGVASLNPLVRKFLRQALSFAGPSARAVDRIVKVSRTLADLARTPEITEEHLAEALLYRRNLWGRR